jgi:hypothetical protein
MGQAGRVPRVRGWPPAAACRVQAHGCPDGRLPARLGSPCLRHSLLPLPPPSQAEARLCRRVLRPGVHVLRHGGGRQRQGLLQTRHPRQPHASGGARPPARLLPPVRGPEAVALPPALRAAGLGDNAAPACRPRCLCQRAANAPGTALPLYRRPTSTWATYSASVASSTEPSRGGRRQAAPARACLSGPARHLGAARLWDLQTLAAQRQPCRRHLSRGTCAQAQCGWHTRPAPASAVTTPCWASTPRTGARCSTRRWCRPAPATAMRPPST